MIMISDINNLICTLFVRLSSFILENFKDRALINFEILKFIELLTYKFGLVYILRPTGTQNVKAIFLVENMSTNILRFNLINDHKYCNN